MKDELIKEKGITSLVFIEIPPQSIDKIVFLYGHYGKQSFSRIGS
jgi:hypothetical protein